MTHLAGMRFDFVMIVLFLRSCCSYFLTFGLGISFFGGFHHSPAVDCSTTSCDFDAFTGDEHTSFLLHHLKLEAVFFFFFTKLVLIPLIHVN